MSNKKALLSLNSLIALILILLAGAVILYFVFIYSLDLSVASNVEACRESILIASQSKRVGNAPLFPLNCPRKDLIIKKEDIVEDNQIVQKKARKIIADAMAECFYMVGEGKVDPFSNFDHIGMGLCLVCKKIKFDESLKSFIEDYKDSSEFDPDEHTIKFTPEFLLNNIMPGTSETYAKYIYNVEDSFDENVILYLFVGEIKNNAVIVMSLMKLKTKIRGFFGGGYGLSEFEYCDECDAQGMVTISNQHEILTEPFYYIGERHEPLCSVIIN